MSKGRCLCGSVSWEITGVPSEAYHCHCSMCRKAHGAAFGTYYFVAKDDVKWSSGLETVREFASSASLVRPFCSQCGSVVPGASDNGAHMYVPAGSHDQGPKPEAHIFVNSKAPWHDITDDLKQFAGAPSDAMPEIDQPDPGPAIAGKVRGSCLCNAVAFEVTAPFKVVHNCHCSRCRQARGAAHTTNGFTAVDAVTFIRGEEHVVTYKLPTAKFFTHAFCDICGSGMPRKDHDRKIAVIPLGALDDDPGSKPVDHIFLGSKADWYDVDEVLPGYEEGPPT